MCVCEGERRKERVRACVKEKERGSEDRERVYMYACVCVREIERGKEKMRERKNSREYVIEK